MLSETDGPIGTNLNWIRHWMFFIDFVFVVLLEHSSWLIKGNTGF
jgi:hypothetical protein